MAISRQEQMEVSLAQIDDDKQVSLVQINDDDIDGFDDDNDIDDEQVSLARLTLRPIQVCKIG